jgi:hypothetical protein
MKFSIAFLRARLSVKRMYIPYLCTYLLTIQHRIIHKMVSKEEQYIGDLDTVESVSLFYLFNGCVLFTVF